MQYNWPGNVRELRNVIERAVIVAGQGQIERRHLPASVEGVHTPPPQEGNGDCVVFRVGTTVEEAERGLILRTLEHTNNNKTRAAEILGISLKTLHNKLKEYATGSRTGTREELPAS
jgi:DNA-binding NtrC family response regulator